MASADITIPDSSAITYSISKLRDRSLKPHAVRHLVADITKALTSIALLSSESPKLALVPVLRSGLSMCDAFLDTLNSESPETDVVVYHLGLFREKSSLQPVEYYNKLPVRDEKIQEAVIVDPLVATGGTARAVIGILRDWGIKRITFIAVLASKEGLAAAASEWPEGTRFVVGAVDGEVDAKGYIKPGMGDIGDRLYGTDLQ